MDVFSTLRGDPQLGSLIAAIEAADGPVSADGLWGSSAPIVAALAAERLRRPLLLVTSHADDADDFRDDIQLISGAAPELFPALESLGTTNDADDELLAERLRVCFQLAAAGSRKSGRGAAVPVVVVPVLALMQVAPSPEALLAMSREVAVGQTLEPDALADWLVESGFTAVDAVEHVGDFARRGGIVDIFSHGASTPIRVEFFGEEIESIRAVQPGTQRSGESMQAIRIAAIRPVESGKKQQQTSFLAHLPADALIAWHEPAELQELGRTLWQRLGERAGIVPIDNLFRHANSFRQLYLRRFTDELAGENRAVRFPVQSLPQFDARATDKLVALRELAEEVECVVLCENAAEEQRLQEMLTTSPSAGAEEAGDGEPRKLKTAARSEEKGTSGKEDGPAEERPRGLKPAAHPIGTHVGVMQRGFRWGARAYVPHHELFSRYRQKRTLRRVAPARAIDSFFDLAAGDLVVHVAHGIARFRGLKALQRDEVTAEYLELEFAETAVVHVPISQIHLVQKYIGSAKGRVALSKLGGNAWKRTKDRVAASVTDLAGELLAIQASRATQPGIPYPADTGWQREFEDGFLYEETEDQLRALSEIKSDMARPRPMDRLLCGDVGFGKTEMAIRAAFKVAEYGKQVAVLVPTTVLCEQHFQTFSERLADYPFRVRSLSRFRTAGEQKRIIEAARRGEVEILIGTHRLLSSDVKFADLGLVIIDEEQRFGVEAKERLKRLRSTVDVLTLSATPIPRTLHMSLLGIRDISSLQTPPIDRRSIVTQVRPWEDALIREAILRELTREGQVYFVHNVVRDIHMIAAKIRELAPEARVVVGHGQMPGHELEEVMLAFMNRQADILVATTIIESGIDNPRANTMFIHQADRYGLADLHQLRGRVGRSKHRAYCYLLLSKKQRVTDNAAKRLKAIEQYSELGAGFQIAMRDLEIRGAGNILGAEQSGNIEAVGYEMYCQLLEQACRRMKNEDAEPFRPVNLELRVAGSIPRAYIRSEKQRMEVYKRLTVCHTAKDVASLEKDLRDAFGPLPPDVRLLVELAEIRVLARPYGIRSIVVEPPDVIFAIDDLSKVQELFSSGPGSPRMPDAKTIHWRLPAKLLEAERLVEVLKKQLGGVSAAGPAAAVKGRMQSAE
ncbi:MAG: transcription-repair coupling factor [Phycisphaerae bacterium]|nr:transcription-repair coupling factor [Phycisphaerae bacterium]